MYPTSYGNRQSRFLFGNSISELAIPLQKHSRFLEIIFSGRLTNASLDTKKRIFGRKTKICMLIQCTVDRIS